GTGGGFRMNIANQETQNNQTYTALFEGSNERYLIVCRQNEDGNINEMYIRDSIELVFTKGTEEEQDIIEQFLREQHLKSLFSPSVFFYPGMNTVSTFENLKHFTKISNEIHEEVSLFVEQNRFETKKNKFNEDLKLFSKEIRTRNKNLMEMNDPIYYKM